ncbi:uncharacterized protein LOC112597855 [Melanaphis sacchari]|uniref:uncharacterized protein LOC112597855 n=1 Tax=Melanaphis sacchari TaxID=742174 RepID=UPI000DC159FC|nr:uncharacterized protein LOC112597855 [Melanaphis sacchari]
MNKNNRNSWDARRPSLDCWWESVENQNNQMPDQSSISPEAIQNTIQWVDQSLQRPKKNITGKKCKERSVKKSNFSEICKIKPCVCMELKLVIRSNTKSLTDDVCSLYHRWLCGPLATNFKFHYALLTLINLLKTLIKDLNGISGKHDQLELLVKRYGECRGKYQVLLMQLDQASMSSLSNENCVKTLNFLREKSLSIETEVTTEFTEVYLEMKPTLLKELEEIGVIRSAK